MNAGEGNAKVGELPSASALPEGLFLNYEDGDDVSIMRMPERASYRQAATTPSRKAARALSSRNVARPMSSRVAVRAPSPRFTARASSRHTRRARAPSRNSARPPSRHATRSASSRFMARLTSRNSVREARGDAISFLLFSDQFYFFWNQRSGVQEVGRGFVFCSMRMSVGVLMCSTRNIEGMRM